MDENLLMDLYPEVQECRRGHQSKPAGISDPTQTAAVAADGVKERHVQEGKQADRVWIYCGHQEPRPGMGRLFDWRGQNRLCNFPEALERQHIFCVELFW